MRQRKGLYQPTRHKNVEAGDRPTANAKYFPELFLLFSFTFFVFSNPPVPSVPPPTWAAAVPVIPAAIYYLVK